MNKKRALVFSSVFFCTLLVSCSKKPEPQTTLDTPLPIGDGAEPVNPEIRVGVDICDDFLRRYRQCVDQLPESIKASMQEGLTKTERTWKNMVKEQKDEKLLRESCQKLEASVSTAMKAQGCKW